MTATVPSPTVAPSRTAAVRLLSLDAVRGLAIVIMLVAVHPGPRAHLPAQLKHPEWHGLTFADLFFPLFLFAVGASMAVSRRAPTGRLVLRRAVVLVVLGIALASLRRGGLAVAGVLQHIAVAYVLAWLMWRAPRRVAIPLGATVLVVAWVAFVLWAGPGDDPWGRHGTLAHDVDRWLLGGFTTEGTLQSAVSSVNVLAGAIAMRVAINLRDRRGPEAAAARLGAVALVLIGAAALAAIVVPLNKHLWTPSFAILTAGTSIGWFALAVWLVDGRGHRRPVQPLVELGANPIAIYVVFMAAAALIRRHLPELTPAIAPLGNDALGALCYSVAWLLLGWIFARTLYRRELFLKI